MYGIILETDMFVQVTFYGRSHLLKLKIESRPNALAEFLQEIIFLVDTNGIANVSTEKTTQYARILPSFTVISVYFFSDFLHKI